MADLVAAAVRQREAGLALADAGEIGGEVAQLLGDEMDDLALALDAPAHRHHAGGQDDAAVAARRRFGQTTRLAMPVSSSRVMNMTPLAEPGRWRTSTRPAASSQRPSRAPHRLGAGDDAAGAAAPRAGRRPDAAAASGRDGGSPRPPRRRRSSAGARRPAPSTSGTISRLARRGGGEQRQGLVAQRPDRPERLAPGEAEARAGRHRPRRAGPARPAARDARRQRSSTEAKGWSARAATMRGGMRHWRGPGPCAGRAARRSGPRRPSAPACSPSARR